MTNDDLRMLSMDIEWAITLDDVGERGIIRTLANLAEETVTAIHSGIVASGSREWQESVVARARCCARLAREVRANRPMGDTLAPVTHFLDRDSLTQARELAHLYGRNF